MATEITLTYSSGSRSKSFEMGTRTGFMYSTTTMFQSDRIDAVVTECDECIHVNGKLYLETWMKKSAYKDLRYQYADLIIRKYDGTAVRYHDVASLEDELYTAHSITQGDVEELGYKFQVTLTPDMFANTSNLSILVPSNTLDLERQTIGRIEWHFNEELFGVSYFNIVNNIPLAVERFSKMDIWHHCIPPVIRLNQTDTNYRMTFELMSSRTPLTFQEDQNNRILYITELRATNQKDKKIKIRSNVKKVRKYTNDIPGFSGDGNWYTVLPKSFTYYDYYTTSFLSWPEITEEAVEFPFEIALLKVSQWVYHNSSSTGSYYTPTLTGEEICTCNGRFIIESKP